MTENSLLLLIFSRLPSACLPACLSLPPQMFERFLEERTANPTQPEVRFFDESIAAKLNRSKTNPIKKDTPFLNDQSDAPNQARGRLLYRPRTNTPRRKDRQRNRS